MERRLAQGLRFGVAARVKDPHGRVLLVWMNPESAWTDKWVTPGGGSEPKETPREAIRREIREETGLTVRYLRLWKVYHESLWTRGGRKRLAWDFLEYTALSTASRPRPRVPHEISEVRWFRGLPRNTEFRDDWIGPPRERFRTP